MPKYKSKMILKAIDGSRGYITVVARRLGCSRNTITDRLKKEPELSDAMEVELDKKGDDAEMLLEQMMSEKIPIIVKRLVPGGKGKQRIVEEERMVFSRASPAALIFFCKTKLKKRGYVESHQLGGDPDAGPILVEISSKFRPKLPKK